MVPERIYRVPGGFQVRPLSEVGAWVQVPNGWQFDHDVQKKGEVHTYRMFDIPDEWTGRSEAELSVVVRPHAAKKKPLDELVWELLWQAPKNAFADTDPMPGRENPLFLSGTNIFLATETPRTPAFLGQTGRVEKMVKSRVRRWVIGSKTTGTVYSAEFKSLNASWYQNQNVAEKIFGSFEIDPAR